MTTDYIEAAGRDDLAPAHRLHIIAGLLTEGVRRRREDARRMGECSTQAESAR